MGRKDRTMLIEADGERKKVGQAVTSGLRFEYRAFVGESGNVNCQINSRF